MFGHFGHFLLERLVRLWYVVQHPELKLRVAFLTPHLGVRKWYSEFFQLMGIEKERIIYVDKPIQCRSVIVPEQSAYFGASYKFTKEYLFPFQVIKSNVKPDKVKKIYLTRTKYKNPLRIFCNEEYFEDFFAAHGFKIIAPEKLSIKEQISLVMGADEIAAPIGTLTHWAMFCKSTVKFIMLTRHSSEQFAQIFINEAFNVNNYYIVEAWKKFLYVKAHHEGVFMLGSNKYWKNFVADYFGETIAEDDDSPYFSVALDKYINTWCKKYSDPKNFNIWVSSLKDLCNRIVALEHKEIKNRPLLTYQTHVDRDGWVDWKNENQFSNYLDQKRDIQAIKINFPSHKVYYSVYYDDVWSKEVSNGEQAGTTGKSKPIYGIKIRLDTEDFDIFYRVHWAKNGAELLSDGQKLNALQIKLENKT